MLILQIWNSSEKIKDYIHDKKEIWNSIDCKPLGREIVAIEGNMNGQNKDLKEKNAYDDNIPTKPEREEKMESTNHEDDSYGYR